MTNKPSFHGGGVWIEPIFSNHGNSETPSLKEELEKNHREINGTDAFRKNQTDRLKWSHY